MAIKPAMHGRDHCPEGSDPIPCWPADVPLGTIKWGRLHNNSSSQTVATNTFTLVDFATATVPDAAYFTADTTTNQVVVANRGYYGLRWGMEWTNTATGDDFLVELRAGGTQMYRWWQNQRTSITPNGNNHISYYGLWFQKLNSNDACELYVEHNTGANRIINFSFFEVFLLGSLDGSFTIGSGLWG